MKKYLTTLVLALVIGFFLCYFFINQYSDYKGIKVSNSGEELYFIQYGVFSSKESMEENTINLQNYIYNLSDNMYYVYVGITNNQDNVNKVVDYYKNIGYDTIVKKYSITNKKFINLINNYDQTLLKTNDVIAISSIINQVLIKYEEVVVNGG